MLGQTHACFQNGMSFIDIFFYANNMKSFNSYLYSYSFNKKFGRQHSRKWNRDIVVDDDEGKKGLQVNLRMVGMSETAGVVHGKKKAFMVLKAVRQLCLKWPGLM